MNGPVRMPVGPAKWIRRTQGPSSKEGWKSGVVYKAGGQNEVNGMWVRRGALVSLGSLFHMAALPRCSASSASIDCVDRGRAETAEPLGNSSLEVCVSSRQSEEPHRSDVKER